MGVDDDSTGDTDSSKDHDSAGERRWWRRRWLWMTGAAVVVVVVAAIAIPQIIRPDDPTKDGALPSNIGYGLTSWTPRGSLADDTEFIRDAAKRLPEDDDDDDGEEFFLLWAGRGADDDGKSDFAYFASFANDDDKVLDFFLVNRDSDGKWADDEDVAISSTENDPGSTRNSIIPLPLEAVEGLGEDNDEFYLVKDDDTAEQVTVAGGGDLDEHGGVIGTVDERSHGTFLLTVQTPSGKAYTSPTLFEPLLADAWTQKQAKTVLGLLPYNGDDVSVSLAEDEAITELGMPEAVKFDKGTGFTVTALDHNVDTYPGVDPPNPRRQRSALIVAMPGRDPVVTGPALDGDGRETHLTVEDDYAVAIPEGIPGGPAVAVSGGNPQSEPKLPVIGKPVEPNGPMVFGHAPETTAIIFRGERNAPSGTSLVVQHPEN